MSTWELIDRERASFADLADGLSAEQWGTQTLCDAWRVRDVVAHLNGGATIGTGRVILTTLRYGFRLNTMLEREARKEGERPTDELRREMRETVGMRTTPPGAKPDDMLMDYVVHQQDVRRPLSLARSVPTDSLIAALDRVSTMGNPVLPGKKRAAGLHLRASDVGWEHGDGDEVSGPGEALLMCLAGRSAGLAALSGSGVETLRQRIS
jgi:uncharacterized protein (TIGR03083 family)